MDILTCQFEVLSQMYLSGADGMGDLRPPSIKGALRFWYRAIDPNYRSNEAKLFGGTAQETGQSRVILQIDPPKKPSSAIAAERWDQIQVNRFTDRSSSEQLNGLIYLGFPFQMKAKKNECPTAVAPTTRFTLRCVMPRPLDQEDRRRLLAALWLLGTFGSLGSRSRRGFGSLALMSWQGPTDWADDLNALAPPSGKSAPDFTTSLNNGFQTALGWFPGKQGDFERPYIKSKWFRCYVSPRGDKDWAAALSRAGRLLQDFRHRRNHRDDYDIVKAYLTGQPLRAAPERVVFGLPLRFQFRSLKSQGIEAEAHFGPEGGSDRHPSLLLIKLAKIGDRLHPMFIRLAGALPGGNPAAQVKQKGRSARPGTTRLPPLPTEDNLLDAFISELEAQKA